ncbi:MULTISPECIES: ABC transporter permease [Cohnella]|uniref:ABC-2 type transport system permease protein n=1 Tax=Cohnella phaseoli TaxID=456490 RepID=A0A3D9KSG9_9BACL|nr:ABC transporter permease [Cohnella phaseoli]RED89352.1 ABC-2 type transport system permease protein [Cohnella phaseoli]
MVWKIAKNEWKLLLKEKGTFFWLLGMPILFIVLFGSVLGSVGKTEVTVPYVDNDRSEASKAFLATVEEKSGYVLEEKQPADMEEQLDKIRDGKGTGLLVVPQGFGQSLNGAGGETSAVELYREATNESVVAPLRAVLENLANGYRETKIASALAAAGLSDKERENALSAAFSIDDRLENGTGYNVITQIVPGYTVMFVFFVIISMLKRFLGDKESGMTARLRSTRMSPLSYLLGMWLAFLVVALVQCCALLAFGHFAYGLQLGDPLAVAALVVLLCACGTGIGLAVCMIAKSENQGMAFTQLLTMGGAVLGGLWFPIDLMPEAVQTISRFTPQYWAQKGFQDIMLRGAHASGIGYSLLVLALVASAGLIIALLRYRRFIRTALG